VPSIFFKVANWDVPERSLLCSTSLDDPSFIQSIMPKRKRGDADLGEDQAAASTVDSQQLGNFRAVLDRSQKSLVTALKLARGFERQKMGRRQKNAAKDPKALLQRREEVIVLKQLDLDKTAKNHIVKGLLKSKRARESPILTIVYGRDPKVDHVATVEGVVIGRLFNANPVKVAMPRIMASLFEALGIEDNAKQTKHTWTTQGEASGDVLSDKFQNLIPWRSLKMKMPKGTAEKRTQGTSLLHRWTWCRPSKSTVTKRISAKVYR
jgi:hypothetical protein